MLTKNYLYGISTDEPNKYRVVEKLKDYYRSRVNQESLIDYALYIDINNELASKGFFITDENREEKYLEILETGDDKLIDALEEFLILKDELSILKTARKIFTEILQKLKEADENDIDYLKELEEEIPR
jgi:predicted transcriptional regulator